MATKTAKDYTKELYAQGLTQVDSWKKDQQAINEETLRQINQAVDTATASGVAKYQEAINAAPESSRKLYDENAITEAVNRKRVQESMANMGMTDSGLSGSLHTSLAVARGNADSEVRRQEKAYVDQLKAAIADLYTAGATQKAAEKASLDKQLAEGYNDRKAALWNDSMTAGAQQYAADRDHDARVKEAEYKALEEQAKARQNYALKLLDNDADETSAWASAYTMYPTGDEKTDAYWAAIKAGYSQQEANIYANAGGGEPGKAAVEEAAVSAAENLVKRMKLTGMTGWKTFWSNQDNDGEYVAEKIQQLLAENADFANMSALQRETVLSLAVAKAINENWTRGTDNVDNVARIENASAKLGLDSEDVKAVYTQLRYPNQGKDAYGRYTDLSKAISSDPFSRYVADYSR